MESIVAVPLAATGSSALATLINVVIAIVVLVGPFVIGAMLAKSLRMREYGWRFGVILCSISASCWVLWSIWDPATKQFNFKLGVDLQGGVILIYEVEQSVKIRTDADEKIGEAASPTDPEAVDFSMPGLIEALSRRINPAGTKEIVIRPYGDRSVELIIPEVDQREVEHIKKVISTAGVLQFRIIANARDHKYIIDLARENELDPVKKRGRVIRDAAGAEVGLWARVGRETKEFDGVKPFKVAVGEFTVRDSVTGDLLQIPADVVNNLADETDDARRLRLARHIAELGIKEIDVLMETDDGQNVTGAHLGAIMKSVDELMNPCIHFNLKGEGASLFGELTGDFAPTEDGFHRQLGILLDNELLSAPNIQERITDRGRITGRFTDEEVQFLVNILQAGSLPVVLNKIPISSSMISPLLGQETINQGKVAMVLGMALVFVFMMIYYRFSGFLACVVLTLNLLITLALIVLIKAPLTLPGLAGLVLTIGMAVDSNVLIYERMREELARGGALRMVIRNGFNRATTTIVDSNLTTMLTAIVLYLIGTDQLRGFAVTLTLGLITSMFTAIFCSHVFFDVVERTRFLTTLKMFQFVGATKIDFLSFRHMAVAASLVVILIGVGALGIRKADAFDIDFTGGSSVHVMLEQEVEADQVRKVLDPAFQSKKIPYSLTGMSATPGDMTNNIFKVDSKQDVEVLEKTIQEAFQQAGGGLKLKTNPVQVGDLREIEISTTPPKTETPSTTTTTPSSSTEKTGSATKEPDAAAKDAEQKSTEEKGDKKDDATPAPAESKEKAAEAKTTPVEEKKAPEESDTKKVDAEKEKVKEKEKEKSPPPEESSPDKESPDKESPEKAGDAKPKAEQGAAVELPPDNVLALAAQEPKSEEKAVPAPTATPTSSAPQKADEPKSDQPKSDQPKSDADSKPATEKSAAPAAAPADPQKADEPTKSDQPKTDAETKTADSKSTSETKTEAAPSAPPASAASPTTGTSATGTPASGAAAPAPISGTVIESTLTFTEGVSAATVRAEIESTAEELNIPLSYFDVDTEGWDRSSSNVFKTWNVRLSTTKDNAQKLLERLQKNFTEQPVWSSSNKIGPAVAGKLTRMAIMALIASWLGIIVYVWIRFQNLVFGLAAVIALVHDVSITVAAIAVSKWLAGALGFLLVEDFKISLTIVAALLTIIGYSINDTIVIFDRIREIRGKSPEITAEMVNTSLNQTLSRTILTFFVTFLTVICLYALGGPGIHGFAFAMVIGMITGTYSTVFVATPFVLWLAGKSIEAKPKVPAETTRV